MDESPRKVEHAKAPAASADPAADLALVKRLRHFAIAAASIVTGDRIVADQAADAIERLLRERDEARDLVDRQCQTAISLNERWDQAGSMATRLRAMLAHCLNALESVDEAHPEMGGWRGRREVIRETRALLMATGAPPQAGVNRQSMPAAVDAQATAAAPCQIDGCQYTAALAKGREEGIAAALQWRDEAAAGGHPDVSDPAHSLGQAFAANAIAKRIRSLSPSSPGERESLAQTLDRALYASMEIVDVGEIVEAAPSSPGEPAGSGWQPIATAPKDRMVLVGRADWKTCWQAAYEPERRRGDSVEDEGWYRINMSPRIEPTHWQPLPAPPHEPTGET